MHDFVQSTSDSPFMEKMKEHILPFDCKPWLSYTRQILVDLLQTPR